MIRKLLLARLRSRLEEADKLNLTGEEAETRAEAWETLTAAEATPKAIDITTIMALIQLIIQLIQSFRAS
jgi:hypothetical protein